MFWIWSEYFSESHLFFTDFSCLFCHVIKWENLGTLSFDWMIKHDWLKIVWLDGVIMMSLSSCGKLAVFSEPCFFSGKWFPSNGKIWLNCTKTFHILTRMRWKSLKFGSSLLGNVLPFYDCCETGGYFYYIFFLQLQDVLKNIVVTNKGLQHFCFSD